MRKLLSRRRFLKRAAAGLVCAPAIIRPAYALRLHGNTSPFPSIPAEAQAFGINTPVFFDDFNSLSTVDINNTLAPGKNWYLLNWPTWMGGSSGFSPADPSWFSASASVLTISDNRATGQGGELSNFGYLGSNNWVGQVPLLDGSKPFYLVGRNKFALPTGGHTFIPDFWMQDQSAILAQINGNNTGLPKAEIDILEGGSASISQTIHSWTSFNSSMQDGANADLTGWSASAFSTWAIMSIPMAYNGGTTGFVRWYRDGIRSRSDVTWTSGSTYSVVENSQFMMFMGAEPSANYLIDYVFAAKAA